MSGIQGGGGRSSFITKRFHVMLHFCQMPLIATLYWGNAIWFLILSSMCFLSISNWKPLIRWCYPLHLISSKHISRWPLFIKSRKRIKSEAQITCWSLDGWKPNSLTSVRGEKRDTLLILIVQLRDMGKQDFLIFKFKTHFGGISYIAHPVC